MVHVTRFLMRQLSRNRHRGTFVDKVHLTIQGGNGGMGNQKFGGIGGKGGDVYMQAIRKVKDLKSVAITFPERRIKAEHGGNSVGKQLIGKRGNDVIVEVPCGVRAITDDKLIIGEVNDVHEKIILARGGIGGNPSTAFCGVKGQKLNLTFELSLIADVGLLGFPNAGKSTLLKACSKAKPKIADYPFTTIKPNIGILEFDDFRKISMADLPGLIEGAHANFGMGHKFLRHIERTKLVLMVVAVDGFQLNLQHPKRSAVETIMLLNKELELYNPDYLEKPMALVINKMDLPDSDKTLAEIRDKLSHIEEFSKELPEIMQCNKLIKFEEIIPVSAEHDADGIKVVKDYVRTALTNFAEKARSTTVQIEVEESLQKLKTDSREKGPELV